MKLILTQEVTGLGAPGDVVEVKDGYGRNYLVPRGFAIAWSKGGQATIDALKKARASRAVRDADHATQVKAALENASYQVKARAGEGGRLFGAVTAAEIASAINEAGGAGHEIDKRTIVVANPIKSLGAHTVTVKVHDDVEAQVEPGRLRERRRDRMRFLARLTFTPGPGEWETVHLPKSLFPLYRIVRLARLAARCVRA